MSELVLASGSPRRAELLTQLGLKFKVIAPDIDESTHESELPEAYVERMARSKYKRARQLDNGLKDEDVVLCADTSVVIGSEILGKPIDEQDGLRMLNRLSGNSHQVITAVTVGQKEQLSSFIVETIVKFRTLNSEECRSYWKTGEPCDKAGAYGIQGLGAIFVESLTGSYSNVVGLPLMETAECLKTFNISVLIPERA